MTRELLTAHDYAMAIVGAAADRGECVEFVLNVLGHLGADIALLICEFAKQNGDAAPGPGEVAAIVGQLTADATLEKLLHSKQALPAPGVTLQ